MIKRELHGREVSERLALAGLEITPTQMERLADFLWLLNRWNQTHNLTGIRSTDQMIDRHLLESLALRPLLSGQRIADVGTGAGVPGLPLSIVEEGREFTLIESRAKRTRFLRHAQSTLRLTNVSVNNCRVEDLPTGQPFDTVLARAVAAVPDLVVLVGHLLDIDSKLFILTGTRQAKESLGKLSAEFSARCIEVPRQDLVSGSVMLVQRAGKEGTS